MTCPDCEREEWREFDELVLDITAVLSENRDGHAWGGHAAGLKKLIEEVMEASDAKVT